MCASIYIYIYIYIYISLCVCEYEILLYACVRVDMKLWEEVRMTKHMKESFLS